MPDSFNYEPAPYPPNNSEEMQAVIIFLSLLDLKRVKPDAKFLDKVPNLDGSVELVDEQQRPTGELKIQIKKIPDGALRYDCPVQLVGYSTRVSSPFVLVCVDVGNRKAYWSHISLVMPGLKSDQQTFTVKFQAAVDEIGAGFSYLSRWQALCTDYLNRVSEFPRLKQRIQKEISLEDLNAKDRQDFQRFIDEVNVLLDVDMPVVKHEFFANTWKLGVRIHQADAEAVCYSIYTIQHGENAPILMHVPDDRGKPKITLVDGREIGGIISFHLEGGPQAEISVQWETREYFNDPIKAAREFVFRYLVRLFRQKQFHMHGHHQCIELLMWFTRDYAHTLGLPVADYYKTKDISYGLKVFLPTWYSLAWPRIIKHFEDNYGDMLRGNPFPSFEQIAYSKPQPEHPTEDEVRSMIESGRRLQSPPVRTNSFSRNSLRQAIDYLIANNVEEIHRGYRRMTKNGRGVWNCYTREDLKHNIVSTLEGAGVDYPTFIKGNRFGRLDSPLVSGETALVYAADIRKWQPQEPVADVYWILNKDRSLPLMTFIDLSQEPDGCHREGMTVTVRGKKYGVRSYGQTALSEWHAQQPVQTLLYKWLKEDLNRRFAKSLLI